MSAEERNVDIADVTDAEDKKDRGLFITVEGPDGAGKSTQIEAIRAFFEARGMDVVLTREPGGTAIGERIRAILLDRACGEMDAMTEAMLYAASRAQHVAQIIRPALAAGKVVVCDRFLDSSLAYQGCGRGLGPEAVAAINGYAIDGCMPAVTFLLKVDPDVGKRRVHDRAVREAEQEDRLESEAAAFHRRVYDGYLALEARYPERIVGVDAGRPIEDIRADIQKKLEEVVSRVFARP